MTSLAKQLERLAVPTTRTVFGEDKRRASLLFDPKEAANLDREAVFALGMTGLEELENVDETFIEFESSLFSASSQDWERTLQNKEVNDKLDTTISNFLIKLSPYFQLKAAHKTLEWLIYRYHIHQMNVDAILGAVIPYHETRIFVRLLQLLPLSDPASKWHWLEASAKGGVPPPRSCIVQRCRKEPAFLNFLADLVPKFIKVHGAESNNVRAMVAFYACSLLGVISHHQGRVAESTVAVLVPSLIRALKSQCIDFKAAGYMVLGQLLSQTRLQADFLSQLLPYITKYMSARLTREALLCLALLCQTQSVTDLPRRCFKHLCKVPALVSILANLTDTRTLSTLIQSILAHLVPAAVHSSDSDMSSSSGDEGGELSLGKPQYVDLLHAIITDIDLDSTTAKLAAKKVLLELCKVSKELSNQDSWNEKVTKLLGPIERRYPAAFDSAVALVNGKAGSGLAAVLGAVTGGARHHMISEPGKGGGTSLMLALHHASDHVRSMAVGHLCETLEQKDLYPAGFVQETILERLGDDSPVVVAAVLKLKDKLADVIPKDILAEQLFTMLLEYANNKKWRKVKMTCIDILCSSLLHRSIPMLSARLLPLLMCAVTKPTTTKSTTTKSTTTKSTTTSISALKTAQAIFNSELALTDPLLKDVAKTWLSSIKDHNLEDISIVSKLNIIVVQGISVALSLMDPDKQQVWLNAIEKHANTGLGSGQLLNLVILGECTTHANRLQQSSKLNRRLISLIGTVTVCSGDCDTANELATLVECVRSSNDSLDVLLPGWLDTIFSTKKKSLPGSIPTSALSWAAQQVIKSINKHKKELPASSWWPMDDNVVATAVQLLDVMMVRASCGDTDSLVWQQLIQDFLQTGMRGPEDYFSLLAACWTSQGNSDVIVSATLQAGSLRLLAHLWSKEDKTTILPLFSANSSVFASLVVALLHSHTVVRQGALECLTVAKSKCGKDLGPATELIKKINKRHEELQADPKHLTYIISGVFTKCPTEKCSSVDHLISFILDPTTPVSVKEKLVWALQETSAKHILSCLAPLSQQILQKMLDDVNVAVSEIQCVHHILSRVDADVAEYLVTDSPGLRLLLAALHTPVHSQLIDDNPQMMALEQVTKPMFEKLSVDVQKQLVSAVLDVTEVSELSDVSNKTHRVLRNLKLNGRHVVHEINVVTKEKTGETVKSKRKTPSAGNLLAEDVKWGRVTVLLEALQSRKSIEDTEELATALSVLLQALMKLDGEEVEYRRRLVLTILLNITSGWVRNDVIPPTDALAMATLVECVRSSRSMQTQQAALMVMSSVAPLIPEYVLHNVMLIFTFVGSGLLKQDDSHSFQVIEHTISMLIPALIKAHQAGHGFEAVPREPLPALISSILQVFVDARNAVPRHRCHSVFNTLTTCLGPSEYLWMVQTLLIRSAVLGSDKEVSDQTTGDVSMTTGDVSIVSKEQGSPNKESSIKALERDVEFAVTICEQFAPGMQITACTGVMQFLIALTDMHTAARGGSRSLKSLDLEALSAAQLRLFQFHLTKLLPAVLTNNSFVTQVVEHMDSKSETGANDSPDFHAFLEQALCYVQSVAHAMSHPTNRLNQRFWKALLAKAYEVLDKVLYLMPLTELIRVISELIKHTQAGVRRKALDLLNSKLQTLQTTQLSRSEGASLLWLVPRLRVLAEASSETSENDVTACRQIALFNLKLLSKLLASDNMAIFSPLLPVCVSLLKASEPPTVQSNALLCIAELVSTLRAHAIPHLSILIPPIITLLQDQDRLQGQDLLVTCGLTALHRLLRSLPAFLSPYLLDILSTVCQLSALLNNVSDPSKPALQRLKFSRHELATAVPSRVLIPAMGRTFTSLLTKDKKCLLCLLDITEEHVAAISRDDLQTHQSELTSYFTQILDIRNTNSLLDMADVEEVEDSIVAAILSLVIRLSESSFRPMFLRLYEWACLEDTLQTRHRKLTFFKLNHKLALKLRSLFNLFVKHILPTACKILTANNSLHDGSAYFGSTADSTSLSCQLLQHVLDTLQTCMMYDTEQVFHKDVFKMLLQPLTDTVENTIGGDAVFEKRITNHLCPCMGQFALASKDDSAWKSLNYQILLKMRNTSARVRFAALQVLESVAVSLGEEYMVLLPESVPFLAELMEDEDEQVETKCQQFISKLEDVLGESLQKYF